MTAAALTDDLSRLARSGPMKAWSVIVTVLGDLCRAPGDGISARLTMALIGRMGLGAEAGRVAIHRLKRDGWIEAERKGRGAVYRLSAHGRAETERVRSAIYDAPDPATAFLLVASPETSAADFQDVLTDGAVTIAPRLAVAPGGEGDGLLVLPLAAPVPGWVAEAVVGTEARSEWQALFDALDGLSAVPKDVLDRTALRLLVLHHWRRLRLRHGVLADALDPGWIGARTRTRIHAALSAMPAPPLDALEAAARE